MVIAAAMAEVVPKKILRERVDYSVVLIIVKLLLKIIELADLLINQLNDINIPDFALV